jgi:hypothetical protein
VSSAVNCGTDRCDSGNRAASSRWHGVRTAGSLMIGYSGSASPTGADAFRRRRGAGGTCGGNGIRKGERETGNKTRNEDS